jgi:hypothetical protein
MTPLPNVTTRSGIVTCISGLALLLPASLGLLLAGYPTVLCPFPALTIIPAFLRFESGAVPGRRRDPKEIVWTLGGRDAPERCRLCSRVEARTGVPGCSIYAPCLRHKCRLGCVALDTVHSQQEERAIIQSESRLALDTLRLAFLVRPSLVGRVAVAGMPLSTPRSLPPPVTGRDPALPRRRASAAGTLPIPTRPPDRPR